MTSPELHEAYKNTGVTGKLVSIEIGCYIILYHYLYHISLLSTCTTMPSLLLLYTSCYNLSLL